MSVVEKKISGVRTLSVYLVCVNKNVSPVGRIHPSFIGKHIPALTQFRQAASRRVNSPFESCSSRAVRMTPVTLLVAVLDIYCIRELVKSAIVEDFGSKILCNTLTENMYLAIFGLAISIYSIILCMLFR